MDGELHKRLLRRDPTVMDELVQRYLCPVNHLAALVLSRVGSRTDVEEVVAAAFARAWERSTEYDPERTTLVNWLLMITKYTALDARRRLMRERFDADGEAKVVPLEAAPEPAAGEETPEDAALRRERSQRLHAALDRLAAGDRELLVRRYFLEEPIAAIARDLGLTRTAIDNRLMRARYALRAALTEAEGVELHG